MLRLQSWSSLVAMLTLFTLAPALRAGEEAQGPLRALQYFVGEWHAEGMPAACDPHALQSPQRDGIKLIVHPAVGGAWFAFSWLAYHAGQRSEGVTLMGYDPSQKQYVQHDTSSTGAHGQALAAAWEDDALVLRGTLHNWHGRAYWGLRKTYRKLDPAHFALTVEVSEDGELWEQLAQVTFAR